MRPNRFQKTAIDTLRCRLPSGWSPRRTSERAWAGGETETEEPEQAGVRGGVRGSDATERGAGSSAAGIQDAAGADGCESSSTECCVQSTSSESSMLSSFAIRSTTSIRTESRARITLWRYQSKNGVSASSGGRGVSPFGVGGAGYSHASSRRSLCHLLSSSPPRCLGSSAPSDRSPAHSTMLRAHPPSDGL